MPQAISFRICTPPLSPWTCLRLLMPMVLAVWVKPAQSLESKHPIYGSWRWSHLLYNGQELPRPNPKLRIQFDFDAGGTSRLFWEREGQPGFCERLAQFSIQGDTLVEMITWVNPNNAAECARDPDMQTGRMSRTPFTFDAHGRLMIRVYVADWDVWYVWERVNSTCPHRNQAW